jgi:hypothetical protein
MEVVARVAGAAGKYCAARSDREQLARVHDAEHLSHRETAGRATSLISTPNVTKSHELALRAAGACGRRRARARVATIVR